MACCGRTSANRAYEVTYRDGRKETVDTVAEARMKIAQSEKGGTFKAVQKPA